MHLERGEVNNRITTVYLDQGESLQNFPPPEGHVWSDDLWVAMDELSRVEELRGVVRAFNSLAKAGYLGDVNKRYKLISSRQKDLGIIWPVPILSLLKIDAPFDTFKATWTRPPNNYGPESHEMMRLVVQKLKESDKIKDEDYFDLRTQFYETLKDIAQEEGFDPVTVSRVLNLVRAQFLENINTLEQLDVSLEVFKRMGFNRNRRHGERTHDLMIKAIRGVKEKMILDLGQGGE